MNLSAKKKQIAVLIDPDKTTPAKLKKIAEQANRADIDFFLVGGSLMIKGNLEQTVEALKQYSKKKIYLFPGNPSQICNKADGILLLSLISGRNPDLLIGQHVLAAPQLKSSGLDIIPTGYILVDGGSATAVSYISNTTPIPANKPEIAACTAMAGEMLGLKTIYLEAGSGAQNPVSVKLIQMVKEHLQIPLLVGGGIKTVKQIKDAFQAGADIVIIGTAIENDIHFLEKLKKIR